jgi:hypothetical protein
LTTNQGNIPASILKSCRNPPETAFYVLHFSEIWADFRDRWQAVEIRLPPKEYFFQLLGRQRQAIFNSPRIRG